MNITAISSHFLIWSQLTIISFGYLGILFVNFIASASIIFPVPGFLIVFALGGVGILNPWLIGLSAGIGCTLGELVGYFLGRGSERVIRKRYKSFVESGKKWFKKNSTFPFIILFAATPLPDDIIGILCGMFNYNIKKFFIASLIGKFILNSTLAWGGFYGIRWVLTAFEDMSITWALIFVGFLGAILFLVYLSKYRKRS